MVFDLEKEIKKCAVSNHVDWDLIDNKTILITGVTGLIGRYLIDVLLTRNHVLGISTKIIAVGRDEKRFRKKYTDVKEIETVVFIQQDVQERIEYSGPIDYVIHMASNTHPRLYASDPIGTEMANILGTFNLLDLASRNNGCRFLFTSSGDIYGDNRSDKKNIEESDCGYIDCNTLRAGYIEGKRAGEALCNAFKEERNVDFVIARLCRIYGPTMNLSDSKAIAQFIKNIINREDIILKSLGNQSFSYLYVYDAVTALLVILTKGLNGEAYNVADNLQVLSLRNLAEILARIGGRKVVYGISDSVEAKGASTFQDVRLDSSKLCKMGWKAEIGINEGLSNTVFYLREKNVN